MPFAQLDGLKVYYERAGNGPRLLFISGSGGDLRTKPGVFESPLARAFDLLGYDQRGLGQTDKPDGPYSMQQYADDAAKLLDVVDWSDALVIGVSFGGMVAQEFALRHPHRVSRLVLACTSSGGVGGASYPLHKITDLPIERRVPLQMSISDVRQNAEWQQAHPETVERALAMVKAAANLGGDASSRNAGAALQLDARRRHDTYDRLPELRMPVLLCAGKYDGIAPLENMQAMARRIPSSELRIYEGGHLFLIQDRSAYPEIVAWLRN
jgi:3-oxoadipate enol-lactonase